MKKTLLTICLVWMCFSLSAQKIIDLSGKWSFSIDRQDNGEKEKWFSHTLNDFINLPGSMPEKLKGDEVTAKTQWTGSLYDSSYYYNPYMEKYRKEGNIKFPFFLTPDKHYVGAAWYQKEVNIPADWKGERILLFLERPHIETTVWVNGQKTGMQNSLCVPHQYDITRYVRPGKCTITIRVDNRIKEINVGPDSHSITDQTQGNWNGIVGRICLQTTPKTYFDDIQIYPEPEQKLARVKVVIKGTGTAKVKLSAESFNTDKKHIVPAIQQEIKLNKGVTETEMVLPMGNDMLLWDEFHPALYKLKAEVTNGKKTEIKEIQFGMRRFEIKGKWFYVNGRKTQLRGTVENCDFPLTGYAPMDVESWERVFRICRNYGLNHMRFHSLLLDYQLVTFMDDPSMEYPRKNALSRHDAVTHLLEDRTALVAFLSDLRHLKNHIVAAESGSYRKVCKIKTFHYQIFPKGSILNFRTSCTKLLDLIIR